MTSFPIGTYPQEFGILCKDIDKFNVLFAWKTEDLFKRIPDIRLLRQFATAVVFDDSPK